VLCDNLPVVRWGGELGEVQDVEDICILKIPWKKKWLPTPVFLPREFQKNIYFCFIDYTKAFDSVDHNKLWKILQEMEIPDHLTLLLRNLYAGQEAILRTELGTTDWFQIGKGVRQGCIVTLLI